MLVSLSVGRSVAVLPVTMNMDDPNDCGCLSSFSLNLSKGTVREEEVLQSPGLETLIFPKELQSIDMSLFPPISARFIGLDSIAFLLVI